MATGRSTMPEWNSAQSAARIPEGIGPQTFPIYEGDRMMTSRFRDVTVRLSCPGIVAALILPWPRSQRIPAQIDPPTKPANAESPVDAEGKMRKVPSVIAKVRSAADGRYVFQIDRFPVKNFKPDPVEKPRKAIFSLL